MSDGYDLRARVDEVLYYVWDPIGVSDEPCARGEYRDYAPEIYSMLAKGAAAVAVSTRLQEIIRTQMELVPNAEHCDRTAALLVGHRYAAEEGLA